MKKRMQYVALAVFAAVLSVSAARAADDMQNETKQAIADFQRADSSLQTFIANSAGYAVFPSVGKGGLIVGGAHGKGLLYEQGKVVGKTIMSQATIGAQAGGQSFAEIIFFETQAALNDFKAGKFEMSAEVSAVAASEGASKAAAYKNGVAVFTLAKKGLMVQASVGGQKFKYEPEAPQPTSDTSPTKKD